MLKYADVLRVLKAQIIDRAFVRPTGNGHDAEAALDLIMETVSVLDYDCDYLPGAEFELITNDSRRVRNNSIFAAVRGSQNDGTKFVPQALQQGASVIVSEVALSDQLLPGTINLVVKNSYSAYAVLCDLSNNFPTREMKSLAVTGTNGKTTSAMLLRSLLKNSNQSCGLISTVEYDINSGKTEVADRTTPEAGRLFELFAQMRQNNVKNFAMEVSSHALHQHRIGTLKFSGAVFTNLTGDHLDYHHTMEEYYLVKRTLFTDHLADDAVAVINCDDRYGLRLSGEIAVKNMITFGRDHGQWRISNVILQKHGSSFTLSDGKTSWQFVTNLSGMYNIYNICGVVLLLSASGMLSLAEASELLKQHNFSVPGRLEAIPLESGAVAFVDYAHTHDALSNVLQTLKALDFQRIITVFGAGGDRDRSKRPLMGEAAACHSNIIYLTSDNPRSEDPLQIIEEIKSGIPKDFASVFIEADRQQAIEKAIANAKRGDAVLIAGKGHEDYQEINGVKHHLDDREIVRNFQR